MFRTIDWSASIRATGKESGGIYGFVREFPEEQAILAGLMGLISGSAKHDLPQACDSLSHPWRKA